MSDIVKKEITAIDIINLKNEMLKHEQVDCPIEHEFADGVYSRKMYVPAGSFVIGKMHRFNTYNILLKGDVSVYAGENMPVTRIKAPYTFVSDPLVQKMAYFHEDSIWINIHPTEETDLEKIEEKFIVPESEIYLMNGKEYKKIEVENGN